MDEKTTYVLLGVILGVALNTIKEWWFQRGRSRKDLEYLAIRLSCLLDSFVRGCTDVAADDGLWQGQYGEDGCRGIQVSPPKFEPLSVDVEWRSLPSTLMFEVLNFPSQIDAAVHKISGAFEYAASPPGYEEGFEERQLQYANLGLSAHALSEKLRRIGGLPAHDKPSQDDWDQVKFLREKRTEVQSQIDRRAERMQEFLNSNVAYQNRS